jgi:hypothetical protein
LPTVLAVEASAFLKLLMLVHQLLRLMLLLGSIL